ncbi:MAG: hypothetical protein EPN75_01285, partial [Beijerinckiaceae bacterium]
MVRSKRTGYEKPGNDAAQHGIAAAPLFRTRHASGSFRGAASRSMPRKGDEIGTEPQRTYDCGKPVIPALADYDVIIIGAGAAGLAAGRRLADDPRVKFRILEARSRIGGRAHTITKEFPLDLGCGWLHSADINPFTAILSGLGFEIDKSPPGWGRQSFDLGFSAKDQAAFMDAMQAFRSAIEKAASDEPDRAVATLLPEDGRFNPLVAAVTTYASGVEPDRLSTADTANYEDTGINWRIAEGYGAGIARFGAALPITLSCPVTRVDHSGPVIRLTTPQGIVTAAKVVVTLPTNLLASDAINFDPPLPEKRAAAAGLPLGVADKLILAVDGSLDLPKDGHLFGRTDRIETASYHLRPFGRNLIEAYFGGQLAANLEHERPAAFAAFALDELAGLFGASIK